MTDLALHIAPNGPDVEIRATVDGETHTVLITPTEAYTLATFAEWLLDEREPDLPSTFQNLPDHVAVNLDEEPCTSCLVPHDRPILLISVAHGEALSAVSVIELTHPLDVSAFPTYLTTSAVNAAMYQEPTNV